MRLPGRKLRHQCVAPADNPERRRLSTSRDSPWHPRSQASTHAVANSGDASSRPRIYRLRSTQANVSPSMAPWVSVTSRLLGSKLRPSGATLKLSPSASIGNSSRQSWRRSPLNCSNASWISKHADTDAGPISCGFVLPALQPRRSRHNSRGHGRGHGCRKRARRRCHRDFAGEGRCVERVQGIRGQARGGAVGRRQRRTTLRQTHGHACADKSGHSFGFRIYQGGNY